MSVYRVAGGIAFLLIGVNAAALLAVPGVLVAIACIVAGIALLAGY